MKTTSPKKHDDSRPKPGSPEAMKNFVRMVEAYNQTPRKSSLDPNKPIKQLEAEFLDSDPKYQGRYNRHMGD